MKPGTAIAAKMDSIRTIFQDTFDVALEHKNIASIFINLETTENEFRPVAYEAASMAFALNDFLLVAPPSLYEMSGWNAFLAASENQLSHVYVGLGWALAKQKINPTNYIIQLDVMLQCRVLDGGGYYDGMMRQKQTVRNQVRHTYLSAEHFTAYDQGIGRSIWYISKGDPIKVQQIIQHFSKERHADLWRGIGIACTFVGGYDSTILKTLSSIAKQHSAQLGIGAGLVAKSRMVTNYVTNEIELACLTWLGINAKATVQLFTSCENSSEGSYERLLLLLQKEIELQMTNDK